VRVFARQQSRGEVICLNKCVCQAASCCVALTTPSWWGQAGAPRGGASVAQASCWLWSEAVSMLFFTMRRSEMHNSIALKLPQDYSHLTLDTRSRDSPPTQNKLPPFPFRLVARRLATTAAIPHAPLGDKVKFG
jgi:hypothetical protein